MQVKLGGEGTDFLYSKVKVVWTELWGGSYNTKASALLHGFSTRSPPSSQFLCLRGTIQNSITRPSLRMHPPIMRSNIQCPFLAADLMGWCVGKRQTQVEGPLGSWQVRWCIFTCGSCRVPLHRGSLEPVGARGGRISPSPQHTPAYREFASVFEICWLRCPWDKAELLPSGYPKLFMHMKTSVHETSHANWPFRALHICLSKAKNEQDCCRLGW